MTDLKEIKAIYAKAKEAGLNLDDIYTLGRFIQHTTTHLSKSGLVRSAEYRDIVTRSGRVEKVLSNDRAILDVLDSFAEWRLNRSLGRDNTEEKRIRNLVKKCATYISSMPARSHGQAYDAFAAEAGIDRADFVNKVKEYLN